MKRELIRGRTSVSNYRLKPNVIQGKLERTTEHKQLHLQGETVPPPSLFLFTPTSSKLLTRKDTLTYIYIHNNYISAAARIESLSHMT